MDNVPFQTIPLETLPLRSSDHYPPAVDPDDDSLELLQECFLDDDSHGLLGDWFLVDPHDPRLPEIEKIMTELGLANKYTLGMLASDDDEGLELVVHVDCSDLAIDGDLSTVSARMDLLNASFFSIDPMIRLGTHFDIPKLDMGHSH